MEQQNLDVRISVADEFLMLSLQGEKNRSGERVIVTAGDGPEFRKIEGLW